MDPYPPTCPTCSGTGSAFSAMLARRVPCPDTMSTPTLRGAEAYAWAWLRHGPLLPYVRAQSLDVYAADRYPRGSTGWVEGRLTMRAAAWWAQHASPEQLADVERKAIEDAPAHLIPAACPVCHGVTGDPATPCVNCMGTGLVHAFQPQPINRPLP